ncbi:conserved hypothetical protein [uncultured Desulfobacterium sp.]|uniref:Uncharacterized protein n=1 Tax=uncultured Desulfobacterium sp. TaxID=201089 RepID=A0A445N1Q1_9BACT|nr:conserved hypothetical protein [uncultured Desulfobacterium sp.]
MDREGLLISERINEVTMMCERENPIYEQISSFSIALYVLGFFDAEDIMFVDDLNQCEAAVILNENFTQISRDELPSDYHITQSREKYLLVIGDPLFPVHFAVLADTDSARPFFSKLKFFGSGFDSLEELINSFAGEDGISKDDIHFFKIKLTSPISLSSPPKIYIVRDDGRVV